MNIIRLGRRLRLKVRGGLALYIVDRGLTTLFIAGLFWGDIRPYLTLRIGNWMYGL